ncbi:hypothetical protein C4J65_21420 [Streptomyces sp. CB09001]|uniref:hypothetical protein n=1 Tax=Streptomyces sp. CB09001 TaxID=2083284 RepID=UPI000E20D7CA|nr:hypothetical protein [Streptomyces sp. CB09001]AXL90562.1 hypothetical protein C4J65_21420 [Streptomyces sp. CB09001]
MADEQDKWLDRETAEFLLRGEPLEGADPAVRDRAERLVAALGALTAPSAPNGEELPGEAAALAAFRKVRAERADTSAGASAAVADGAAGRTAGAGPVRIGSRGEGARRPRRGRPLRLGLAAALTVGMIGGVAAAAGTGVLPTPFDRTEPEPAATVSAAASPHRPSAPPSPLDGVQGGSVPGATPGAPDGGTARDGGEARDRGADGQDPGGSDGRRSSLAASCREVRAGKELDTVHRRALKDAAGGASRVGKYCGGLLAGTGTGGRDGADRTVPGGPVREGELRGDTGDGDSQGQKGDEGGKGGKSDEGEGQDKGDGNGDGNGKGQGQGKGDDGDDGGNGQDDADADIAPPVRGPHHPARPHHPDRVHGPQISSAARPQPRHTGAPHAA